ncbi:MAG: TonB-dependent receptor plug domain-containing protein [Gemmatimonadota bacterium]|nr:TonB-dependent receptor plug domain-containing protein [Gemmatimonadota bacterium]
MPHPLRRVRLARACTLLFGAATLAISAGCHHARGSAPVREAEAEEEVNVGYGTRARRDLTGSVSSVTAENARGVRVARVLELLEDRVPGLQVNRLPNGEFSLWIRGTRSLRAGNEPLIVIDGVPSRTSDLALLSPQAIRRIDVLKDAGSTAAYGSRGANGVILITTR